MAKTTSNRAGDDPPWPPPVYDAALSQIGRIVLNWNVIERTTTQILNILLGGEHRAMIVTAHIGTTTQIDALRTLAAEFLEEPQKGCIFHLIDLFERLRERRNFYVHSLHGMAISFKDHPPAFFVTLNSFSARGRLKQHRVEVTTDDLLEEAVTLRRAAHYFALVHNHFYYPDNPSYQTLPDRFPLPDRLQKPGQFVLGDPPPPRSSRG